MITSDSNDSMYMGVWLFVGFIVYVVETGKRVVHLEVFT